MGDQQTNVRPDYFGHEVKQIVSRISRIDEDDLQDNLLIREELGIDSLMAMEILYACEKHFGIKLEETLFVDVQTVKDFLLLIAKFSGQRHG